MATTTFSTECPLGEWTLLVDGGTFASAGVQAAGAMPCRIAVASSAPAAGTNDFFLVYPGELNPVSVDLLLGTGSNVYGQGLSGTAYVRGFLTAA